MTSAAILDLTQLTKDLGAAARDAPERIERFMDDTANQIASTMRDMAPHRTGALKASVTVQREPNKWIIGPTVVYAVFQEFGTGTRGEFPTREYEIKPKNVQALRFTINGRTIYRRSVKHPGVKAQKFVRRAADQYLESLHERAADVGVQMIVGPNA